MLFPHIAPYAHGMLPVTAPHCLYWERCGHPQGIPVVYLHGGPGDGCSEQARQLFDPAVFDVLLFDQRGCGRSVPHACTTDNTTQDLIGDIESLRTMLGIERWLVFGGSWGSTLALAYAQTHPERVSGLILRGIFLGRGSDVDWFLRGMGEFFPEAWARFARQSGARDPAGMLAGYQRQLQDPDPAVHLPAARAWAEYELACVSLLPAAGTAPVNAALALPLARLEAHYFSHGLFLHETPLLDRLARIRHLPCIIVQGRYDVICPPSGAWLLARDWPGCVLDIVEAAGHSAWEPAISERLMAALGQARYWPVSGNALQGRGATRL